MKKIFTLVLILLLAACSSQVSTEPFDNLGRLSFDEYQTFLDGKESGIIYFGWLEMCPDSALFQDNFFYEFLVDHEEIREHIYVVNLDEELPEGLGDKDLRAPMTEQFGVKYGPTVLRVVDGEVVDQIEWTPITANDKTAIPQDTIDLFFENSGYLN